MAKSDEVSAHIWQGGCFPHHGGSLARCVACACRCPCRLLSVAMWYSLLTHARRWCGSVSNEREQESEASVSDTGRHEGPCVAKSTVSGSGGLSVAPVEPGCPNAFMTRGIKTWRFPARLIQPPETTALRTWRNSWIAGRYVFAWLGGNICQNARAAH